MEDSNSLITLRQAARMSGYHPDYLSSLIRSGQLKGHKIGKTWVTTEAEARRLANGIRETTADTPIDLRLRPVSRTANGITINLIVVVIALELLSAYCAGFANALLQQRTRPPGSL